MLAECKLPAFLATAREDDARSFYRDILELKMLSEDDFALVFDANGTTLRVVKVPDLSPAPRTVLGWAVADIERTIDGLAARGVGFEHFGWMPQDDRGIWIAPDGAKVAWFKDPDGNLLFVNS